jgi:predicted methyltransferase
LQTSVLHDSDTKNLRRDIDCLHDFGVMLTGSRSLDQTENRMHRRLFLATFAACGWTALLPAAYAQSVHTHQHTFRDAEKWSKVFDDPKRDSWQKPHEVIQALRLAPDAIVADIGAGTGYFSVRLAHMVPKGRVYAVDTEADMVKHLAERAKRDKLTNMVPVSARADNPKLPQKTDLVLLVDVYHHIEKREQYFRKLGDSLKEAGRVAVIDFKLDSPEGPPKAARIAPEQVKAELRAAGYELMEEHGFLPYQYFLIFRRR